MCTKDGGGWSILDHIPVIDLPSFPDWEVDLFAGAGDALLLGLGNPMRNLLGINGSVDTTATSYRVGSYAAYGAGMYRASYAMVAKSLFGVRGVWSGSLGSSGIDENGWCTESGISPSTRPMTH